MFRMIFLLAMIWAMPFGVFAQNGVSIFHYDDEDEFIEELNNG